MRLRRSNRMLGLCVAVATVLGPAGCRLQTEAPPAEAQRTAPDFALPAHDGSTVALENLLESGPAIVVFYRGHW